ncbi:MULTISPECIES: TetR family transcriptional regulator [unclassified Actinomyces]|uniref:TetR/AcrR family transcriptional regulator n=1 Tax=unclassified Actinomyces TaxID=2609248 RepID=UPI0020178435|nr:MULTISPECIES: TetR family transcriptional regulator [unclassified Actinomyces]MCL3777369.1 TetR family transcriptional regulator [Actinomyces sp. AC-20-1]MCL3789338.1 TetR family transcriptional regulator [Actinomyces sp. 187325]MCL3792522.1 TetR family transcriptional regulator [Actinomyces sp. 186855]MCL3794005.1 TetR family transcriptional regulator [Actinomyces sp. 217892]
MDTSPPVRPAAATVKGEVRRQAIIEAAAALIRESGPTAISHRAVAQRAGCSLSATTYYFNGLDDLLYHAGQLNISQWAERAERTAQKVEALESLPELEGRIELLLEATLPAEGPYLGHYMQLISANTSQPVGRAYREGRSRLNAAVARVLDRLEVPATPEMIIAIVDGAAVTALSEMRDVRQTAASLLKRLSRQLTALSCSEDAERRMLDVVQEIRRAVPLPASQRSCEDTGAGGT